MERQRRQRDISLSIHSLTLTASPSGSYGLKLSGKAPAMVAQVQKGSPAARAGLQVGDFVLRVAGQETRSVDGEKVLRRLKEEVGKVVEVGVARPSPVPVTDKEKMRALIVLQTKLDSGTIFQPSGSGYSTAVQDALSATRDILGDLGLDSPGPTPLPATQEVEVKMYDSDSLPSPPPSSESEEEKDPLLDFSKDDALTYKPGQPAQNLADSVRQATQALESIKDLTEGLKKKERQKPPVQVTSVASLQTTAASSTRKESSPPPEAQTASEKLREDSPSPFNNEEEDLQWVEPAAFEPPPLPPHSSSQLTTSQPERDVPPPIPPHARTRDQHSEEERKKREREDTRREIERELARRERSGVEEKSAVAPRRQAPKASAVAQGRGVPLRMKQSKERPAGVEEEGKVVGKVMGYKSLHPPPSHPAPSPPADEPVSDLADQPTALRGLPPSIVTWRGEEVATWLFQLSPTLSQHYRPCFSRHDITGQTLMRLNLGKLKSMGIDNIKHCQQLGLEIAKLKIYQESLELRELEEENQLSFL